jgi:hypothetical protein
MYCMIHLLEIIRLSDFSSPLFYPSLLGLVSDILAGGGKIGTLFYYGFLYVILTRPKFAVYKDGVLELGLRGVGPHRDDHGRHRHRPQPHGRQHRPQPGEASGPHHLMWSELGKV